MHGVVERITYQNQETGFCVIKIRAEGFSDTVTLTGKFISINVGAVIEAKGNFVVNKKFGSQFNVSEYSESMPASILGIEKYLGSGLIEGVGSKFASKIIEKFGKDTIDIIENNPQRLLEIPKIGSKRVEAIVDSWQKHRNIKDLMMFLSDCGVSTSIAHKIYKVYGKESILTLKENPYRVVDDIDGVGFKTADIIAEKFGYPKDSYNRCRTGIFYILSKLAGDGHCYSTFDDITQKGKELLDIEPQTIAMTFSHLTKINELVCEDKENAVYLPPFYYSEIGIAKRIYQICKYKNETEKAPDINRIIKNIENQSGIIYNDTQLSAIKTAVSSKFTVIVGGPGVGKTTITRAIIHVFKFMGKEVILTAPTGRAAKRMTELCNTESKTIHRLLEADQSGRFNKDDINTLDGDVIIIDESSMIDTVLMYNLLKAIPDKMIVIMVGDADQLPSVNAGNVLRDIINSKAVPVVRLNKIYRQTQTSKIITNSHKINLGEVPDLSNKNSSDFFFIYETNPENIVSSIKNLCAQRLPNCYKIDRIRDIQVLSPMKRGLLGTENLNTELQSILNDNKLFIKKGASVYKLGDKVMQIKNNYDKNVFNGDIGLITSVNLQTNSIDVNFDGNIINYLYQELDDLSLSYAITIHKSQGGEFPIIIIPIHYQSRVVLQRNLIYTGITRAKKLVVLIGDRDALQYAVKNSISDNRKTLLKNKIIEKFKQDS